MASAQTRRPALQRPHDASQVQTAILDAADRLIPRLGYRKTTIEDIARAAGIGKGTTYLHFASKEEVALGLVNRAIGGVFAATAEIASRDSPPLQRIHEMLLHRVLGRYDAFSHYSDSLHDMFAAIRPLMVAERERQLRAEERIFAQVLEQGNASSDAIVANPTGVARTLLTATNSLLPYYLSTAELGSRKTLVTRTSDLAEVLIRGLARR